MRRAPGILLALIAAAWPAAGDDEDDWRPTEGWFTLHHDVQRTGRTQDSPAAPFEYAWHREYFEELIAPEAEPIVAEGRVFAAEMSRHVTAFEAKTGAEMRDIPRCKADLYHARKLVAALEAAGKAGWVKLP